LLFWCKFVDLLRQAIREYELMQKYAEDENFNIKTP